MSGSAPKWAGNSRVRATLPPGPGTAARVIPGHLPCQAVSGQKRVGVVMRALYRRATVAAGAGVLAAGLTAAAGASGAEAAAARVVAAGRSTGSVSGTWDVAQEAPGTASLNAGGH